MDDDDEYLYGGSRDQDLPLHHPGESSSKEQRSSLERAASSNGVASHSEGDPDDILYSGEDAEGESEGNGEGEESDDDIEIIMEPTARSVDFRQNRPSTSRTPSHTTQSRGHPSLTTEYTPHERGGLNAAARTIPQATGPTPPSLSSTAVTPTPGQEQVSPDDYVDPNTLPPVTAPPSHPAIDPTATGILDGRSILEYDLTAIAEKPWRRPGSDISDWFNYGFDELSWEAYCYRRREVGDNGSLLKANVLNFAGMPEDQLTALPPEVRQMVMTGATAMLSGAGANAMMGAGVGMNPMMDMSAMGTMNAMNMGAMGMGMNGEMGMQMQPGGPMMSDVSLPGSGVGASGTPEQGVQMGMQDGFSTGVPGSNMMGMGMGAEFGIQEQQMGQQMYPNMESNVQPAPTPASRGASVPTPYRGRGAPIPLRGRGGFQGRGRGRGMYGGDGAPPIPVRPASPLPPGVPTGPRNQNKYKDRDGNAPAVDGLDYGGTQKDSGGRTPTGEMDDRSSRKRRNSPGMEDGRGSKRR